MSATNDDFGPFVGPLDITAIDSPTAHDLNRHRAVFLSEARASTERNRRAVLDEILHHQDDPLYWHRLSPPTPAPPIQSMPNVHTEFVDEPSSPPSSWFSTLGRVPAAHNALPFTRSLFSSTNHHTTPRHAQTMPVSATKHLSSSPFASHIFVPIDGAPGFKPDEYDWDKGFSTELEHEAETTNSASTPELPSEPALASSPSPSNQGSISIGEYIEKRVGSVELIGRRLSTIPVLNGMIADKIRSHLPALSRLPRSWSLIYSLDQHGISLKTLYSKCESAAAMAAKSCSTTKFGMILVVKDSEDTIFGAWIGDGGLRLSKGNEGYYGSGESFLWKWVKKDNDVKVFKWTGKNNYIVLGEPDCISFGGGDGSFGLSLDDTLYEGTSAKSITFANDVLCSTTGPRLAGGAIGFECVGVEVWGVG